MQKGSASAGKSAAPVWGVTPPRMAAGEGGYLALPGSFDLVLRVGFFERIAVLMFFFIDSRKR